MRERQIEYIGSTTSGGLRVEAEAVRVCFIAHDFHEQLARRRHGLPRQSIRVRCRIDVGYVGPLNHEVHVVGHVALRMVVHRLGKLLSYSSVCF
jgi:hypothetical protein